MSQIVVETGAASARLGDAGARLREGIAEAIEQCARDVVESARTKASGEVLEARSGKLRDSIVETGLRVSGGQYTDGVASDAPYARIQEYGGRIAIPEIVPKNARALAFAYGGKLTFVERTRAHDVTIPERSFLRSSLAETAAMFVDAVRRIVQESLS